MRVFWFVAVLERPPAGCDEGVMLAQGFSEQEEPDLSPADLRYALLIRVCCPTLSEAEALVRKRFPGSDAVALRLITDDVGQVVRRERSLASGMRPGDVSFRTTFIGFKRGSAEAQLSAIRILERAVKRRRWQFWK